MNQVVLFQPEIPQNTGNIARTCAVTGASLRLIPPLGFNVSSRSAKRAGLDYWDDVDISIIDSLEDYIGKSELPFYFFSTKGSKSYTDINFKNPTMLIFGSETRGLPQIFHDKWQNQFYRIPMLPSARSLNLSNAVAIVLYEALRQQKFMSRLAE